MIAGMGVDLAEVSRFAMLLSRFGYRAAEKILGVEERDQFSSVSRQDVFIAKRWAVKEAFGKALGTGIAQGMTLPQIQVRHGSSGEPGLVFDGVAEQVLSARNIDRHHVSISDERLADGSTLVCAVVILERSS